MKNYKISEIAKISATTVKALRVYEEKGLLSPVRHGGSNYRMYAEEVICKIRNIKLLQSLGFSLNEISMIHKSKNLEQENLRNIFLHQLNSTATLINDLEERKLILTNIIEKINLGEMDSSKVLTTREKDIFMGMTTGFSKLDQLVRSNNSDQLIVIAGRPDAGKTSLTVHIAYNLSVQADLPICFFSTEICHEEWVGRLASQKCEFRFNDNLSEDLKVKLKNTENEISKKSIYFKNNKNIEIDEIINISLDVKQPLAAVVVDWLQDINGDSETKCKKLKLLASKINCPVIVISTVSSDVDHRENIVPNPTDVNDYETMKGYFDRLLIVSRDPKLIVSESKAIAKIDVYSDDLKKADYVNLIWDGSYCGFSDRI
ncbi:MAG: DnaB-like helicase C-terminal domain-containing protein [Bacteriovorax sp.]|nr:DnaB-like helicase C-terminal domain-containing protein [Bacteriovorax sp.]